MSIPRAIRLCLLALGALLLGAQVATATPQDVIADYYVDGQIDPGRYSTAELKGALAIVGDQGGSYDAFKDLVNGELTARLVGGHDGSGPSAPIDKGQTPTQTTTTSGPNELPPGPVPTPPASVTDDGVPLGFIVLSVAAGLLVIAGGGMALARRMRRR